MPAITSPAPSPSTSATAGAVRIWSCSTGAGKPDRYEPDAASQPPTMCSNGIRCAGVCDAMAKRVSTRPEK